MTDTEIPASVGVQGPGADAALQKGVAKLGLTGGTVLEIAERPVEGPQSIGKTGVHHPGNRVMPEILLVSFPWRFRVVSVRVVTHQHAVDGDIEWGFGFCVE